MTGCHGMQSCGPRRLVPDSSSENSFSATTTCNRSHLHQSFAENAERLQWVDTIRGFRQYCGAVVAQAQVVRRARLACILIHIVDLPLSPSDPFGDSTQFTRQRMPDEFP